MKSRIYAKCVRTLDGVVRRGGVKMLFFREHFSNKNDVLYFVCGHEPCDCDCNRSEFSSFQFCSVRGEVRGTHYICYSCRGCHLNYIIK